jgi:hypothetical protein
MGVAEGLEGPRAAAAVSPRTHRDEPWTEPPGLLPSLEQA